LARSVDTLFDYGQGDDPITTLEKVDRLEPPDDLAKDCVATVEMGLGRMGDEELAAAGILAGEGHAKGSAQVGRVLISQRIW
jgi:hypothetical protein